jgi:methylmalonyl-CoA/ethylmalonyl-CoA epimerase
MKFDHIGIVIRDLASGRKLLEGSVGVREWTAAFDDEVNEVLVQFGRCGSGICYELVAPRSASSPVSRVLAQHVNTINHVAYLVCDLAAEAARLLRQGFAPAGPAKPAIAYGNRPIQFFFSSAYMLIELIEAPDHIHLFVGEPTIARADQA